VSYTQVAIGTLFLWETISALLMRAPLGGSSPIHGRIDILINIIV
jgi:hypothetical protein